MNLLLRPPLQRRAVRVARQPIFDRLEFLQGGHALRFGADHCRVDGIAGFDLRTLFQVLGVDPLQTLVLDVGKSRVDVLARGHSGAPGVVLRRWHRQRRQFASHVAGRLFPKRNRVRYALEVRRGDVTHDDVDADVPVRQAFQLQIFIGHDANVGAAQNQLRGGLQLLALELLFDEIDDDDDVGTQLACHVHRDVADHAAVRENVLISDDRREGARDSHAGAHGSGQVAVLEHHHLAGEHVGRDGAIGDRQAIEVRLRARPRHVAAQQVFDAAGVDDARRQHDPLVPQAHFDVVAVGHSRAFLLDGLQVAPAGPADHLLPVDTDHELFESVRGDAGRVAAADQGTHAGAGDAVDRDAHFFQDLEHTDMGTALGSATGQHQSDAGPRRCSGRRWRGVRSGGIGRTGEQAASKRWQHVRPEGDARHR